MKKFRSFLDSPWPLRILLIYFVALMIPGLYPASRDRYELLTFSWDEVGFMLPPVRDIMQGNYPGFYGYGNVPAFVTTLLFWPVLLLTRGTAMMDSAFHLALICRATQVAVATLGLYFLYRLARQCCSAFSALLIVFVVMTCPAYCIWTFTIHPDITQAACVFAAVFFLMRWMRQPSSTNLFIAGICCGLATGTKYWGVFTVPAGLAAIGAASNVSALPWRKMAVFVGVSAATFIVFNLQLIFQAETVVKLFQNYNQSHGAVQLSLWEADLLRMKWDLLRSPQFFGPALPLAYAFAAGTRVWNVFRQAKARHLEPLDLIHLTFVTMLGYFLFLFNDPVNLPEGERYLIPFLPLLWVPVAAWAEGLFARRASVLVAAAVMGALVISQGLRMAGIPAGTVPVGGGLLWGRKQVTSTAGTLRSYYSREEQGRFLVREWIIRNVDRQSTIYGESYLNISPDLPVKNIYGDMQINLERIRELKPTFIFTRDAARARAIEDLKNYRFTGVIGNIEEGKVFVFRRAYR